MTSAHPAPQTDAPQTDAPQTDAPQTDAPQTDETQTDASHAVVLTIDGTWNARDVATLTGLRPGVLLRSAALARLTDVGREAVRALGVTDVIDLRSDVEVQNQGGDAAPSGTTVHRLPITPGAALAGQIGGRSPDPAALAQFVQLLREPEGAQDFMASIYREMVTDPEAIAALGAAVNVMAEAKGAVLVHCSAGKDRTGVLVAIAAMLAGADETAIETDFLYSNEARDAQAAVVPDIPGLDPALLAPLLGVSVVSLHAAQEAIGSAHGSVEGFLTAAGVSDEAVAAVRSRLTA